MTVASRDDGCGPVMTVAGWDDGLFACQLTRPVRRDCLACCSCLLPGLTLWDKIEGVPFVPVQWGCSSVGEHLLCKQGARGSTPLTSTTSESAGGVCPQPFGGFGGSVGRLPDLS